MTNNFILTIYKQSATVFKIGEVSLLFPTISRFSLQRRLAYYVSTGQLKHVRQGVYAKQNYNNLELANKLYTPSYISFATVLRENNVMFQVDATIYCASYLSREIKINNNLIKYHKISVVTDQSGITYQNHGNVAVACVERAFLDTIYIFKNFHFDNLSLINWSKARNLAKIYRSQILEKRVEEYYKISQEQNVR